MERSRPLLSPQAESGNDRFAFASELLERRRNVSPKRLVDPGPNEVQLRRLLELAAAAPDHGLLVPWRFVLIPVDMRDRLAQVFASALIERDPGATTEQIESAREKAHRAPTVIAAIARLGPDQAGIPDEERLISLGAAIQNILLGATALGFGSGLTSGSAMNSRPMRTLLSMRETEFAVCCINLGRAQSLNPSKRVRPAPEGFFHVLC
jgi:nitroreductase